jgi:hypothetical protein
MYAWGCWEFVCVACEDYDGDGYCAAHESYCEDDIDGDIDGDLDCDDEDCQLDPVCTAEPCILDTDCDINEFCADGGVCSRIPGSSGPHELYCDLAVPGVPVVCSYWSDIPDVQVGEQYEADDGHCPPRDGAFSITATGCEIPPAMTENPCCSTEFGSGECVEHSDPELLECPWRQFDPTL